MASAPDGMIHLFFEGVPSLLRNRRKLKNFLVSLIRRESKGRRLSNLNLIFCTDQALLEVNRRYLGHDFYTDVISFDLSFSATEIIADIYISVDRVKDNSRRLGNPLARELHRVIFHGILHVCGYKDKTAGEQKIMKAKEEVYLNLYFARFT
jgi:rRNA maturation RNase YbeY